MRFHDFFERAKKIQREILSHDYLALFNDKEKKIAVADVYSFKQFESRGPRFFFDHEAKLLKA